MKLTQLHQIMKETEEYLVHCDGTETPVRFNELFVSRKIIIDGNEFCMVVNAFKEEPARGSLILRIQPPDHSHTSDRYLVRGTAEERAEWLRTVSDEELKEIVDKMNLDCNVFYWP